MQNRGSGRVNKTLIHITGLIINIFHLLLCVTEIVKQSQTVRDGRFESSFLTWPGEPNTRTLGSTSRFAHATFPLSFQPVDLEHSPQLQGKHTLHLHVASILDFVQKRVRYRSTRWSNLVLQLTDYHISRHVASTFKRLMKCATHRGLKQFQLFRRGITSTQPRPLSLYFNGK